MLLATFSVTGVGDDGPGSLRSAIERANATPGADAIACEIPGEGPLVIEPSTPMPTISEAVVIDGYTQPGARPNALAEGSDAVIEVILDGAAVTAAYASTAFGLNIEGDGGVVRGLAIRDFGAESPRGSPIGGGAGIIDPTRASDSSNYAVTTAGPDGWFGTADDRPVPLRSATVDAASRRVTLLPKGPLALGRFYRVVDADGPGGLLDADGQPIDGDGDGRSGGDYDGTVAAGNLLRYRDADGDRIALALLGGVMHLTGDPDGDARALRIVPRAGRNILLGRLRPDGDGLAVLLIVEPAPGLRLRLPPGIVPI